MPRCPYGPHVLALNADGRCKNCDGDLQLYAALRWLPMVLYNDALRLAEMQQDEAAEVLLQRVIALRPEFKEAMELIACIESRRPGRAAPSAG